MADKPTTVINDEIYNPNNHPEKLAIPSTQNESDCNHPQSYNVNLFHLVDVVYPARIPFDKTKVNFKHEFDSCGKDQTRVCLKIQCRERGSIPDDFYKHLVSSKCKCRNTLVFI